MSESVVFPAGFFGEGEVVELSASMMRGLDSETSDPIEDMRRAAEYVRSQTGASKERYRHAGKYIPRWLYEVTRKDLMYVYGVCYESIDKDGDQTTRTLMDPWEYEDHKEATKVRPDTRTESDLLISRAMQRTRGGRL